MFTIENGTPKALNPVLSPDGRWIAYRGRDNSSVYLVQLDGSGLRLLLDGVNAHMLAWSASGWLGVSLGQPNSDQHSVMILHPDDCTAYRLPDDLNGYLRGLVIR